MHKRVMKIHQLMHEGGHGPHGHGPHGSHGGGRGQLRGPGYGGGRRGRGRGRRRHRVSRGDVRIAVLTLLEESPMHGYQIMQELEERSGGGWQPSPGSVYPTLQQLSDEGLITSRPLDGKNVFSLTEDGATAVAEFDGAPPWERFAAEGEFVDLRRAIFKLGAAARQVGMAGSPSQALAAQEIIDRARRELYYLLAEDEGPAPDDQAPEETADESDESA